jgi:hypothetical protein
MDKKQRHVLRIKPNRIHPGTPNKGQADRLFVIRKVPANSVPYGPDICRVGRYVWAAYTLDGVLVGVGATRDEARNKTRVDPRAFKSTL